MLDNICNAYNTRDTSQWCTFKITQNHTNIIDRFWLLHAAPSVSIFYHFSEYTLWTPHKTPIFSQNATGVTPFPKKNVTILEFHDHIIWNHRDKCISPKEYKRAIGSLLPEIDVYISEIWGSKDSRTKTWICLLLCTCTIATTSRHSIRIRLQSIDTSHDHCSLRCAVLCWIIGIISSSKCVHTYGLFSLDRYVIK